MGGQRAALLRQKANENALVTEKRMAAALHRMS